MAMAYKGGPGDKRGLEHCRTGDPMYPDGMGHHLRGQGGMNYMQSVRGEVGAIQGPRAWPWFVLGLGGLRGLERWGSPR